MKRALLAVLALALVLALAGWQWSRPKDDIALPGPDTSPEQTVEAYVEALNARDFATSNAILLREDDAWHQGRWSRAPRLDDLEIESSRGHLPTPEDGQTMADDHAVVWHVQVRFDLHGGDASMEDGPTSWGYWLGRGSPEERWRIVDQGMG